MDDLIAFLNARLDEDEAAARAALDGWPPREAMSIYPPLSTSTVTRAMTAFFGRHDPARALREVEAKRRLIEEFAARSSQGVAEIYLATLAAVYSDHPDYRAEWKP